MNRDSIDEMEQIQRGLEHFLEKEMEEYRQAEKGQAGQGRGSRRGTMPKYGSEEAYGTEGRYDLEETYAAEGRHDLEASYAAEERYDLEETYDTEENWDEGNLAPRGGRTSRVPARQSVGPVRGAGRKAGRPRPNKPEPDRTRPIRQETERKKPDKQRPDKKKSKKSGGEEGVTGRRKKRKPFKRFFMFLLLLCILLGGLWYGVVNYSYDQMTYSEIASLTSAPMKEKGVTNILLVGNDSRSGGEDGRSDAMILLSINPRKRAIYMTSLLRDMYVEIPGREGNRLNAAYAYGGPELLMETIEQNLGIEVNRYVLVNFRAFANLVDAVGGVDLELTNEEVIYVNGYLVEYNIIEGRNEGQDYMDESLSGMVHLNGAQALAYSRNRYIGTDFARTERQRKVLSQVMKKLPKAVLTNPKGLIDSLFPNLTTNLTRSECLKLSLFARMLPGAELVQGSVPIEGSYAPATIRKMSVLEIDFEKNKAYLQETIYGGN